MVDRPVERTERARDEGLYADRVGQEKKEKEKYTKALPKDEKQILFATFFSYLKGLFDTFSPSKKLAGKVIDIQEVIEHLQKLKGSLKKLAEKDLSTSSEFASTLSEIWTGLLEDFDQIEIIERKNVKQIARFRELMDTIKNYPPNSDHHFGYYLVQHAGKDWLPFPFIEMLESLHQQHQEEGEESTLSQWFSLIDSVISNLKSGLPFRDHL